MSEKKFLKNYELKIEKMSNINQSSELTGQDSAKKSEKQFLFSSESQKNEYNLNKKDNYKKAVSVKVEENKNMPLEKKKEKIENANIPENHENLAENIGDPLFDDYMYDMLQNREFSLSDMVDDSEIQDASKILSNKEKYNIPFNENFFDTNTNKFKSTKYIFAGFKDS